MCSPGVCIVKKLGFLYGSRIVLIYNLLGTQYRSTDHNYKLDENQPHNNTRNWHYRIITQIIINKIKLSHQNQLLIEVWWWCSPGVCRVRKLGFLYHRLYWLAGTMTTLLEEEEEEEGERENMNACGRVLVLVREREAEF